MFSAIQRSTSVSSKPNAPPLPAAAATRPTTSPLALWPAVGGAEVVEASHVFECTVGQKPSRAPYYLNDPSEVMQLLARVSSL